MKLVAMLCLGAAAMAWADTKLGEALTLKDPVSINEVLQTPAPHVGKLIQVKGKVTEVCQQAGCWMALADPGSGKILRIKVNDGDIVFPKTAVGKMALAEGTLKKIDLTHEQAIAQAKHEAEEQGRKFNPKSVKGGQTIYQIQGKGAVLLD